MVTKLKSKHLNITNINGSSIMSSARSTERGCKQAKGVQSNEGSWQVGKRRASNKDEKHGPHGNAQVVASVVGRI